MVHHDEAGISDTNAHDELKRKISFKRLSCRRLTRRYSTRGGLDEQVIDHQDIRFYELFILASPLFYGSVLYLSIRLKK